MMTRSRHGNRQSVISDPRDRSRHHVALDAGTRNGAGNLERSRFPMTGAVLGELLNKKNGEENAGMYPSMDKEHMTICLQDS